MLSLFAQSELRDLIVKVEQGERLLFNDGVRLMKSKDILALGYMANLIREKKNQDRTYFSINHLTNDLNIYNHANEEASIKLDGINATMFYGQKESAEERVEQLIHLRDQQDKKSVLLAFNPSPFLPNNKPIEGVMGVENTTGFEDLRTISVSRILLDNFQHIKTFWILLGPKLAQVSLNFGVDDLDGVVVEERNEQVADTRIEHAMSKRMMIKMIHKAGRQAIERDTLYQVLNDYGWEGGTRK
jgi:aminodeoxyfutalosine synthase